MRTVDPSQTAARRRQILDSAIDCFQEKGFRGAAMSAICKKAEMSPGHLYHYFSSKEEIIEAIAERDSELNEANIATLLEGGNALDAMIEQVARIWSNEFGINAALNAEIMAEASRNPAIAAIIRRRDDGLHRGIAETIVAAQEMGHIDEHLDAEGFSTLLMALVNGLKIADEIGAGLDRKKAVEAFRLMLNRCLRPES